MVLTKDLEEYIWSFAFYLHKKYISVGLPKWSLNIKEPHALQTFYKDSKMEHFMVLKAVLKDQRDIHTDSTGRHVAPPNTLF